MAVWFTFMIIFFVLLLHNCLSSLYTANLCVCVCFLLFIVFIRRSWAMRSQESHSNEKQIRRLFVDFGRIGCVHVFGIVPCMASLSLGTMRELHFFSFVSAVANVTNFWIEGFGKSFSFFVQQAHLRSNRIVTNVWMFSLLNWFISRPGLGLLSLLPVYFHLSWRCMDAKVVFGLMNSCTHIGFCFSADQKNHF